MTSPAASQTEIHPTAVVHPEAALGNGCRIGPFCMIGPGVQLGDRCELISHVSLQGPSQIGSDNHFHPFCSIGGRTQDLKYAGEPTRLVIGDGNTFRESVTINRSTDATEPTTLGSHNHLLAYAHIAHNCTVGDHCIFSNNGTLAGHVIMEDYAIMGGLSAVHQFCRIGRHAMIGGCTKVVQDIPPYCVADGNPACVRSINTIGLQRRDVPDETISILRKAFKHIYHSELNTSQACTRIEENLSPCPEIEHFVAFIRASTRGIVRGPAARP